MTDASAQPPRFQQRPHGLQRLLFRLPIGLYRLHLGWLLGQRFLLLTHTGRISGQRRQTVLEVVRYEAATRACVVVSGFGPKSDWYLNVRHTPQVTIDIGRAHFAAHAVELPPDEAVAEFRSYARRHPQALKLLARALDYPWDGSEASYQALAQQLPVIAFRPANYKEKDRKHE